MGVVLRGMFNNAKAQLMPALGMVFKDINLNNSESSTVETSV